MYSTELHVGDTVDIDDGRIIVRVVQTSYQAVRLTVEAARSIPIRKLSAEAPRIGRQLRNLS